MFNYELSMQREILNGLYQVQTKLLFLDAAIPLISVISGTMPSCLVRVIRLHLNKESHLSESHINAGTLLCLTFGHEQIRYRGKFLRVVYQGQRQYSSNRPGRRSTLLQLRRYCQYSKTRL